MSSVTLEIVALIVLFHYALISVLFLFNQLYVKSLANSFLLYMKSPKYKSSALEEIEKLDKSTKFFFLWPYFLITKLKDELVKRK